MSELTAKHRGNALRWSRATPVVRTRLELDVRVDRGGVFLSSVSPGETEPEELEAAIDRARAAIAPTLSEEQRADLVIEAGLVEQSVNYGSASRPARQLATR